MGIEIAAAPLAYALLLVIGGASLYGLMADQRFITSGLLDLNAVRKGRQYHRVVTSAFLHADLGHLLVNMLTFFFFAPAVEVMFGTEGFFVIFFGSQIAAMALTMARHRKSRNYQSLGASGAVSGVLLAFCVVRPFDMLYLFFAIPVPAIVFAFAYIFYSTFAMGGPGRISHEAHLGGALGGAVIALLIAFG